MSDIRIRPAEKRDAAAITILADIAGYGLPCWLWSNSPERRPNESVMAFGRRRVLRDEGAFSYRNAHVAECNGDFAGLLLGYRQPDEAPGTIPNDMPPLLRPLLELEALASGTWYVNILAVFDEFRGRNIGRTLLDKAVELAAETTARGLSVIVESDNVGAMRLYQRAGYRKIATRPFVPFPGCAPAESWILLVKPPADVAQGGPEPTA